MKKQIYVIYTGGTIGMKMTADGYAPSPGYLAKKINTSPEFQRESMPAYTIKEYISLLDSANMMPDNWVQIAQDIADNYDQYDGFVILHGTDTMAYTASALAFMLEGLAKPVIFTGSQIPFSEDRNDARENLITAFMLAANYAIPEVCLYFSGKLLRGCRATKSNADEFDAFSSPNFPPLGVAGVKITLDWNLILPPPLTSKLTIQEMSRPMVGALRLFPGIWGQVLHNILQPPLKGLVLEAYGVGNGPDRDHEFIAALQEATARGVVIVGCSQCERGTVNLGSYATGATLAKVGVISGFDLTPEAALTKLFYLFSAGYSPDEVKVKMQQNLRGELTVLA